MKNNDAFVEAARDGDLRSIQEMIASGVSPDSTNIAGATALEMACVENHENIALYLLDRGASPNPIESPPSSSPLIYAATKGNAIIVQALLNKGADINLIDDAYEQTALIWACSYGRSFEVVKILLSNGADKNIKDAYGNTALILAKEFGFSEIVKLLE